MKVKHKLFAVVIVFVVLIASLCGFFLWQNSKDIKEAKNNSLNADINAIEHMIDSGDMTSAKAALHEISVSNDYNSHAADIIIASSTAVLFVIIAYAYVYVRILKPFERMHDFAANVAAGDLDTELKQERGQYFGEFTWAFDSMRSEIKKARKSEAESIENNKTVIAALSHDIKTPISSIRTYSEALEANLDKTPEKRQKYLNTIIDKCDEVSRLTDDLFIHSVSDMDRMSVNPVVIDLKSFFVAKSEELMSYGNVKFGSMTDVKADVNVDPQRMLQICENIIGNAGKYAPGSNVEISLDSSDEYVTVSFRDYGPGIPEENLPFITQKFYRGANVENVPGSGLGLYIVNYLCTKMDAQLKLSNVYDGETVKGLLINISFNRVS